MSAVRLACGSKSIKQTLCPALARLQATSAVVLVLPTPPLKLANDKTVADI